MINVKEDKKLNVLNHSCAHLLAQAVKHLYPNAKFWVGPVIEDGFYYDIDLNGRSLTEEDLEKIEKEMKKISKDNKLIKRIELLKEEDLEKIEKEMKKCAKDGKKIIREEISKEEALEKFKDDPYKIDLIERMDEDSTVISCYTQGDFTDLCRGPHMNSTKDMKYFKLLKVSGAYYKGDSKNQMLQSLLVFSIV